MMFNLYNSTNSYVLCCELQNKRQRPIFNLFYVNETQDSLSSYYKTYYIDIHYVFFAHCFEKAIGTADNVYFVFLS